MDDSAKIKLSTGAVKDIRSLSSSDVDLVISFLEHLAKNPYDQKLIGSADAKGDLFASSVTDRLFVYWSFDVKGGKASSPKRPPKINVLGLARKTASGDPAPLAPLLTKS